MIGGETKMGILICGLISALILLIYGGFLIFVKEAVSNKDIIIYLFVGFAYVGYMFQIYFKRY